jgi:hypothetical protein
MKAISITYFTFKSNIKNSSVKKIVVIKNNNPMSGCRNNKVEIAKYRIVAKSKLYLSLIVVNICETKIIKNGFMASDGCKEKPKK